MNKRLKKIIYNKLSEDLRNVEIIPYKDSVWFINRENKYWYLEYEKSGYVLWRWEFFMNFFALFSMKPDEFQPIIGSWVEDVLNCKVNTSREWGFHQLREVEDVLNCKVKISPDPGYCPPDWVEDILNCKVKTSDGNAAILEWMVEDVLNQNE